MSDERIPDDVQNLWQRQPATVSATSIEELRQRSHRLQRIVSRRNLREYVAAAIGLAGFGYMAWTAPLPLMRVAGVLTVAAMTFIVFRLHRDGAARAMPGDLELTSCVQFHRGELE